jgi:hypothetical protein
MKGFRVGDMVEIDPFQPTPIGHYHSQEKVIEFLVESSGPPPWKVRELDESNPKELYLRVGKHWGGFVAKRFKIVLPNSPDRRNKELLQKRKERGDE